MAGPESDFSKEFIERVTDCQLEQVPDESVFPPEAFEDSDEDDDGSFDDEDNE